MLLIAACSGPNRDTVRSGQITKLQFNCDDGSLLNVSDQGAFANIVHGATQIQLPVRPSGVARSFMAGGSTLIIDDDRAYFVEASGTIRRCRLAEDAHDVEGF